MEPERIERRLAAILAADVVGYSRLMGIDEEATLCTLKACREVINELVDNHRGRIFGSAGDSVIVEFRSAVEAIRCAVAIQQQIESRNDELPEERRMRFRIGINLGDVIIENDNLFGDGVNVAARLEGIADPGGICLSHPVYEQVKKRVALKYTFVGEQEVKNIAEPVAVYRVEIESAESAETGHAPASELALELPDKPSIAVMPFLNMSDDPDQEFFADGITEDLITDVSKIPGLFVIARNTVFSFKNKLVNIKEIAKELGVQYVLESSVRRIGEKVRINTQLIDGVTGLHRWAERYDREVKDIFSVQDEITRKIVESLKRELTKSEQQSVPRHYPKNFEAYEYYLHGLELYRRYTKEETLQARESFNKALKFDPEFAAAHEFVGWTHVREWTFQWSLDPHSLENAFERAQRAITLDESRPGCYRLLSHVYLWRKQHERAIVEAQKSITLNPNYADGYAELAAVLTWASRPDEAIGFVKYASRLNPECPSFYMWTLGHAYWLVGQPDDAIKAMHEGLARNPTWIPPHVFLAVIYSELGEDEKARAAVANVRRLSPDGSLEVVGERLPYMNVADLKRVLEGLRKAEPPV